MQAKDDYEKVAQAQARGVKKGNVKKMKFMQTEEGEEIPVTSPRSLQRYDSMNAKVGNDVVVQEDQDKGSCDHDEQVKIIAGPVCVQRGSVVNFFCCVSIPEKQEEYKIEK